MSGGGGGVGGATGTLGGLVALFFVLVAYLSLYLVQEGLGDDLGVETYTNGSGFTTSRSTPKPYFVMWTLHSGYVVWLVALLPGLQTFLFINGMPLLQIPVRNLCLAALFNCALLASDYMWSLSLVYTDPAPNAAIFQALGAVVYLMSLVPTSIPRGVKRVAASLHPGLDTYLCTPLWTCIGVSGLSETCCASHSWRKDAAVLFSMFGIAVIFYGALSGESAAGSKSYWWGYVVELIAVFFFAFYEILYEKYKPTSEGNAHGDHARLLEDDSSSTVANGEHGDGYIEGAHPMHTEDDVAEAEFTRKMSGSITVDSVELGGEMDATSTLQSTCGQILDFDVLFLKYLGCSSCLAGSETKSLKPRPAWTKVPETLILSGCMGLMNFFLMWPGLLILNALPCDAGEDLCVREPLNNFPAAMFSPKDCEPAAFLRLFLNALAGSVYTGSFLVGIFLAGSLFMSLGLVLIVPVVNIYTYFIGFPAGDVCDLGKGVVPDTYNNIGSVLIIIGFLVMNVDFYGLTRSLFQRCGLCSGDTNTNVVAASGADGTYQSASYERPSEGIEVRQSFEVRNSST